MSRGSGNERGHGSGNGSGIGTRIVYCNCTFAKVVPDEVKKEVLGKLSGLEIAFDAVADLCEMSARKDPALQRIAASGETRIVACYPRAVDWLFHAAGAPLPKEGVKVLNMRTEKAAEIVDQLKPGRTGADGSGR